MGNRSLQSGIFCSFLGSALLFLKNMDPKPGCLLCNLLHIFACFSLGQPLFSLFPGSVCSTAADFICYLHPGLLRILSTASDTLRASATIQS